MNFRLLVPAALLTGLLTGCNDITRLNLEVTSLVAEDSPMYTQASTYLPAHTLYLEVTARLDCPDETPDACLLKLVADEREYDGATSSLIVHVATGVQALPGPVDFAGVYQYDVEPVTYAAVEDVGFDDYARRYNYVCQYESGDLRLDAAPAVGQWLEGQFDLSVSCLEQLAPDEVLPAQLKGRFGVYVDAAQY